MNTSAILKYMGISFIFLLSLLRMVFVGLMISSIWLHANTDVTNSEEVKSAVQANEDAQVSSSSKKNATNPAASTEEKPDTSFYQEPFGVSNQESSSVSYVYLILRMLLVLAAFLGIAYLLIRFLKKRNEVLVSNNPLFKTVAEFPMNMVCKLVVVRIVKDYHIFILNKENAVHVQQLSDKESIDEVKMLENQTNATGVGFFKDLVRGYQKGSSPFSVFKPGMTSTSRGKGDASAKSTRVKSSLSVTSALEEKLKKNKLKF